MESRWSCGQTRLHREDEAGGEGVGWLGTKQQEVTGRRGRGERVPLTGVAPRTGQTLHGVQRVGEGGFGRGGGVQPEIGTDPRA